MGAVDFHPADFFVVVRQVDSFVGVHRVGDCVVAGLAILRDLWVADPVAESLAVVVAVCVVVVLIFVAAAVFFSYQLFQGFANLSVPPVLRIAFLFLSVWMHSNPLLPVHLELCPGGLMFLFFLRVQL